MSRSRSISDIPPSQTHETGKYLAFLFAGDPRKPWLAARSHRSLAAAGVATSEARTPEAPCLLLQAGQVLRAPDFFKLPPSLPGRDLVAIGLPPAGAWAELHARHGGDYSGELPPPLCEWHSSPATAAARLRGEPLPAGTRVVHWPALDLATTDERLSVYQIVTSLQHGGAEKIARDLAEALPGHGIATRLVVLGKPHRRTLAAPAGFLDLSQHSRRERAGILAKTAIAQGADVLHVHLTDADETRALAKSGIPVIATVHNARHGWPRAWESLQKDDLTLMLACSQAAETELRQALPGLPVRTVWNGINPNDFPETPLPSSVEAFTLACVANPRPQKRLELLPAIVAATRAELASRGITTPLRLIIAGETSPLLEEAIHSRAAVDREAIKHGIDLTWTEGTIPVREVLAQAHALISCSAHEGLSLAHLEALSSGRPLVACDTGGTRELAWNNPAATLLDEDAPPAYFATVLTEALLSPPPSAHKLIWRDFTTDRMAERVARFARQAACRPHEPATTLWFVTNNLSMGGAQSSLRRLAKSFHARGLPVRIALLQEYPEHPTPGRTDLLEHGIEVFVPSPAGLVTAQEAVDLILAEMAATPPAAVVFWNAITTHKLLLADALPFTRVHDISPGEMWFSAFESSMQNPPPGLPCRVPGDYGRLLESFTVKYAAEAERAAAIGAPVKIIPNGVLLPAEPRRRPAVTGAFVFGTAARISPQKRLDELIAAFRLALPDLPEAVLKIAGGIETGTEDCAAELRELSRDLPVEWLGETQDIGSFHAACDVFAMISDPAGCPNASLEALASGLPVIATDIGGASEQVIDGLNGYLVPKRDIPALAAAMVEIARDPARRDAMSAAAREHIRRHFLLERMTDDYLRLFLPMHPEPPRVLVTGASGFIGRHVVRQLAAAGHAVTALDLRPPPEPHPPGVSTFDCDLRRGDLPEENFAHIVHLAALGGVRPSMERPLDYLDTNLGATIRLLEHSRQRGLRRFVFASSSSVYGPTDGTPSSEDNPLAPCSPYALTKLQGEQWGRMFAEKHGIDFIALRFFAVWGPGQRPDLALESFRRKILAGEEITIHGDGGQRRDLTQVSDIVRGVEAALAWPGHGFRVFNLGTGTNHSVNDMLRAAERWTGMTTKIRYGPAHPADVPDTLADVRRAKAELGWEATVSFDTADAPLEAVLRTDEGSDFSLKAQARDGANGLGGMVW